MLTRQPDRLPWCAVEAADGEANRRRRWAALPSPFWVPPCGIDQLANNEVAARRVPMHVGWFYSDPRRVQV